MIRQKTPCLQRQRARHGRRGTRCRAAGARGWRIYRRVHQRPGPHRHGRKCTDAVRRPATCAVFIGGSGDTETTAQPLAATRCCARRQPGEQIALPDRRLTTTPRCASGHGYFSPRATEEGKATEGHRATIGIGRLRLRALPVFLGGPRWLCLPRWPSVRNLAGCRSRAGRPWQNATSPARHSSDALAPGLGRTSEPEPTKSEARLKSARLARIFQFSSAEKNQKSRNRNHRSPAPRESTNDPSLRPLSLRVLCDEFASRQPHRPCMANRGSGIRGALIAMRRDRPGAGQVRNCPCVS